MDSRSCWQNVPKEEQVGNKGAQQGVAEQQVLQQRWHQAGSVEQAEVQKYYLRPKAAHKQDDDQKKNCTPTILGCFSFEKTKQKGEGKGVIKQSHYFRANISFSRHSEQSNYDYSRDYLP